MRIAPIILLGLAFALGGYLGYRLRWREALSIGGIIGLLCGFGLTAIGGDMFLLLTYGITVVSSWLGVATGRAIWSLMKP
jgi:hypothetical protein